jgi:NAD(P)-dependent dehydrogenase (short-subunit alcohol dehydrogenase family)
MDLQIDGNAALVTASSSGLGKASAKALAREGANVVINGRNEGRLNAAAEEIREGADGEVVTCPGDLTVAADIERMVERTVGEFGGMDHLVTSAGGPPSGPFSETDEEDWYDAYELLVMSVVRLIHESTEHLQASGGGTVLNITSHSVKEAIDSLVLSNSVRMGVIGLEKTLSRELAPEVRVNAVLPASHETQRIVDLIKAAVERDEYDSYAEGREAWADDIPLGQLGDPDRLGDMVAFLSSFRAEHVNGQAIVLDGGSGRSNL